MTPHPIVPLLAYLRIVPILTRLDPLAHWLPALGLDGLWRFWGWRRVRTACGAPGWRRVVQATFDDAGRFVRC